jgi:hypothetical protein
LHDGLSERSAQFLDERLRQIQDARPYGLDCFVGIGLERQEVCADAHVQLGVSIPVVVKIRLITYA